MHCPHHVLPADGALAHPLPAFGASHHVATFKQHTVNDGVHADAAKVFVRRQLSSDAICGGKWETSHKWLLICRGQLVCSRRPRPLSPSHPFYSSNIFSLFIRVFFFIICYFCLLTLLTLKCLIQLNLCLY